jgi:hypothetical protein
VIGIVGSTVSGLIVYWANNFFISKREKKEYWASLDRAKSELSLFLKPLIAEKTFPDADVLEAIIRATAQKYGVEEHLASSIDDVLNDIIKEISENPFLNGQQKIEFCKLVKWNRTECRVLQISMERYESSRHLSTSRIMSRALAVTTIVFVALMTYVVSLEYPDMDIESSELLMMIAGLTLAVVFISLLSFLRRDRPSDTSKSILEISRRLLQRQSNDKNSAHGE